MRWLLIVLLVSLAGMLYAAAGVAHHIRSSATGTVADPPRLWNRSNNLTRTGNPEAQATHFPTTRRGSFLPVAASNQVIILVLIAERNSPSCEYSNTRIP